jgi:rubrerythrin
MINGAMIINEQSLLKLLCEEKNPVLVLFFSPDLLLCNSAQQIFSEALQVHQQHVKGYLVNVRESSLWEKFAVKAIPSLLYFKEGVLLTRDDVFADKKTIEDTIVDILQNKYDYRTQFVKDIKYAMEAERDIARFYAYIARQTQNGKIKSVFQKFADESDMHSKELKAIIPMFPTEVVTPADVAVDEGMEPENYSLVGAIKNARELEERAVAFYRKMEKCVPSKDAVVKRSIRNILSEEKKHLARLKKEEDFLNFKQFDESLNIAVAKKVNEIFL